MTSTSKFLFTASTRGGMPEWKNVESPMTATTGLANPAAFSPAAMEMLAPMLCSVHIASNGGLRASA